MNKRKPWTCLTTLAAALALLLPAISLAAYPAEVPRTGQTACYDINGAVITCAGTGQDGDKLAGVAWPNPRFVDNGDGTVTDKLTGLEWTKDANPAGGYKTWQDSLDYVKTLTTGGHTDWRVPNINEIGSLISPQLSPALPQDHPFTNVPEYIWSSTNSVGDHTSASGTGKVCAWFVGVSEGYIGEFVKMNSDPASVWPVRTGLCGGGNSTICLPKTGQTTCYDASGTVISCVGTGQDGDIQAGVAWPSPRFVDNGDGTVLDKLTGLEWTKDAYPAGVYYGWQQGFDYVKTLNTGGHTDWRVPNVYELRSLADYSRYEMALPQDHPFTNVQGGPYRTSTTCVFSPSYGWAGYPCAGGTSNSLKDSDFNLWPVRTKLVDEPVIPISTTTTAIQSTTTSSLSSATTTVSSDGTTTTTATGDESTTTTTVEGSTPKTICPSTKVLGADNPNLQNLRDFRDSKLAQSSIGRKAIQIYYANADSINAALESSPVLRAAARRVLEVIAPMVGGGRIGVCYFGFWNADFGL